MALKGNLLLNGDFERGSTEGWQLWGDENLSSPSLFTLSASSEAKYRGSYGGKLYTEFAGAEGYLVYDKTCSFEECEAYLGIMYAKMVEGFYHGPLVCCYDDKGNLMKTYILAISGEKDKWTKHVVLLRGISDITHFKIGHYFIVGAELPSTFYIDEVKLIPLKSIKGIVLYYFKHIENLTSNMLDYLPYSFFGRARVESMLHVDNVSGTDPRLDVTLTFSYLDYGGTRRYFPHATMTSVGLDRREEYFSQARDIRISYNVSGTDVSFDIYHHVTITFD